MGIAVDSLGRPIVDSSGRPFVCDEGDCPPCGGGGSTQTVDCCFADLMWTCYSLSIAGGANAPEPLGACNPSNPCDSVADPCGPGEDPCCQFFDPCVECDPCDDECTGCDAVDGTYTLGNVTESCSWASESKLGPTCFCPGATSNSNIQAFMNVESYSDTECLVSVAIGAATIGGGNCPIDPFVAYQAVVLKSASTTSFVLDKVSEHAYCDSFPATITVTKC